MNMLGITKLTAKHKNRIPGYIVRLGWTRGNPKISKEFSLADYATYEQALASALDFRDAGVAKLMEEEFWPKNRYRCMDNPQCNNKSGVNGVHRARQWGNKDGKRQALDCYAWVATWHENKKMKTASFAEMKWGADAAFQMACECREARENVCLDDTPDK